MGNKQCRDVQIVVQRDEPFAQFLPDFGVHRAERFIQQQHARLGSERARDGHALTLAAGKLVRITFLQSLQAEKLSNSVTRL